MNKQWNVLRDAIYGAPLGDTKEESLETIHKAIKQYSVNARSVGIRVSRQIFPLAKGLGIEVASYSKQDIVEILPGVLICVTWCGTDGRATDHAEVDFSYNEEVLDKLFDILLEDGPIKYLSETSIIISSKEYVVVKK